MAWYQDVVMEYLKVDRSLFLNPEYCIQLKPGKDIKKGEYWYCDVLVADFASRCIFLSEISYAKGLNALCKRLKAWDLNWPNVCDALFRDSKFPQSPEKWQVRPWLFIPGSSVEFLVQKLRQLDSQNFIPRITTLEMVQPWNYPYNRDGGEEFGKKPNSIPEEMKR